MTKVQDLVLLAIVNCQLFSTTQEPPSGKPRRQLKNLTEKKTLSLLNTLARPDKCLKCPICRLGFRTTFIYTYAHLCPELNKTGNKVIGVCVC